MDTNEVSRLHLRSASSSRASEFLTAAQFIRVTAITRTKSSIKNSRPVHTPKYQENQVDTAVNCSFETLHGKEQEDPMTEKYMLSGYLRQPVLAPSGFMNKFKLLRKLKSVNRPRRALPKDSDISPKVLSVLMTQHAHKRHRKVTSLVHNPLSNGLAKVKEMEARKHETMMDLSPLTLESGSPKEKRSKSLVQYGRSSYRRLPDIEVIRLIGSALTPDRIKASRKAIHSSNLYGKLLPRAGVLRLNPGV